MVGPMLVAGKEWARVGDHCANKKTPEAVGEEEDRNSSSQEAGRLGSSY